MANFSQPRDSEWVVTSDRGSCLALFVALAHVSFRERLHYLTASHGGVTL